MLPLGFKALRSIFIAHWMALLAAFAAPAGVFLYAKELFDVIHEPTAKWMVEHGGLIALVMIVVGLIALFVRIRSFYSFCSKIDNIDCTIEVRIGDLLDHDGPKIIGTNTTFDTSFNHGIISRKSIQGIITEKHFGDNVSQLDQMIDAQLAGDQNVENVTDNRNGKKRKHALGTTISVETGRCLYYWVAINDMNEHGTASGSLESISTALPRLWMYVKERGRREPLGMPLLGSKFLRIKENSGDIFREITESFLVALQQGCFTDRLVIYIHPNDAFNGHLDLEKIREYLTLRCKYPPTKGAATGGRQQ